MTLQTIELQTGDQPVASIVVLHGLGADGNDFVPIAQELDLSAVGPGRFVFPHAPVRPVTLNGGMAMRAWYDILGSDLARREDEPGLRASVTQVQALLEAWLDAKAAILAGKDSRIPLEVLARPSQLDRLASERDADQARG